MTRFSGIACVPVLLVGGFGCTTWAQPKTNEPVKAQIHLGAEWFEFRARHLGVSQQEAVARDGELDDGGPPQDAFWDQQMAVEAASLWRNLCNECHGGKRSIGRAKRIPPPAPDWGQATGRYFGRNRSPQQVYRAIRDGTPRRPNQTGTSMPAWGGRLANEQIWAMVWFLEHASSDVYLRPGR